MHGPHLTPNSTPYLRDIATTDASRKANINSHPITVDYKREIKADGVNIRDTKSIYPLTIYATYVAAAQLHPRAIDRQR